VQAIGFPLLCAVLVWWSATGAILFLDGLPRRSHRWSMAAVSVAAAAALVVLALTRNDASSTGAYAAFGAAIVVWGWNEMAFLMGYATGTRRVSCPPGLRGWRRFRAATQTIIHHELLIAASALLVVACTWDGSNLTGLWAFVALWGMRLSAKVNLFLGVRNVGEEFLPEHLRYLGSYFARRSMNPWFPLSVLGGAAAAAVWLGRAFAAGAEPGSVAGAALVGSLLLLAVLEHLFMVIPVSTTWLWQWGLSSHARARRVGGAVVPPAGEPAILSVRP
jgi:putative photosynthetic complex assembly protein 2